MNLNVYFQRIEYLAASFHDDGITGREIIVLTIRPDDWLPHSSGGTRRQVERPQLGPMRLLAATPLLLILLLAGCSTRVDISSTPTAPGDPPATETFHTNVTVDLLTAPEEAPRPRSQPPAPTEVKQPEVEVAGIANFAMIVEGDLHLHTHYHIHTDCLPAEDRPASRRNQEKSEAVEIDPRSAGVEPRCKRLLRDHLERVETWKSMMGL